jgi:hypothetical protein
VLQASENQTIEALLGDKGYDAQLRIPSTIIAVRRNTNGTRQWPMTPYRREMKRSESRIGYGQPRFSAEGEDVADAAMGMLSSRPDP